MRRIIRRPHFVRTAKRKWGLLAALGGAAGIVGGALFMTHGKRSHAPITMGNNPSVTRSHAHERMAEPERRYRESRPTPGPEEWVSFGVVRAETEEPARGSPEWHIDQLPHFTEKQSFENIQALLKLWSAREYSTSTYTTTWAGSALTLSPGVLAKMRNYSVIVIERKWDPQPTRAYVVCLGEDLYGYPECDSETGKLKDQHLMDGERINILLQRWNARIITVHSPNH